MQIDIALQRRIVRFLSEIPDFDDRQIQKQLVARAQLPSNLELQLNLGGTPLTVANLLVATLINYGMLDDGRYALEVVLAAAKSFVDEDQQVSCDELIREFCTALQGENHSPEPPPPSPPRALPVTLHKRIRDFLCALPDIHDIHLRQALINHAGLDDELQMTISFGASPAHFVQMLIPTLIQYDRLRDGRNALEAVLIAAQSFVDETRQADCEQLLREVAMASSAQETSSPPPSSVQQKSTARNCERCGTPLSFFEKLLRQTKCKRCR